MATTNEMEEIIGSTLIDVDGDKIGKISDVYLDEDTNEPEWITVNTGLFGTRVHFAPLQGVTRAGDDVRVPYSADKVKGAPHAEADGELSSDEEATLYEYYSREAGRSRLRRYAVADVRSEVIDLDGEANTDRS